jgi:hypothetical protein
LLGLIGIGIGIGIELGLLDGRSDADTDDQALLV